MMHQIIMLPAYVVWSLEHRKVAWGCALFLAAWIGLLTVAYIRKWI